MFRKSLIDILLENPMSLPQIARQVGQKPKDVETDLKHLLLSLRHSDFTLEVYPSECRRCDFVFGPDKLHKPSKCPKCKGSWLTDPEMVVHRKETPSKSEEGS